MVTEADLPTIFLQQQNRAANYMTAFTFRNPITASRIYDDMEPAPELGLIVVGILPDMN